MYLSFVMQLLYIILSVWIDFLDFSFGFGWQCVLCYCYFS